MATDDRARTVLHESLDEAVGPDAADTLMEYLPPVGWADVATKADLLHLEARLEAKMDQRFAEVDTRFAELDGRFSQLEASFERALRQGVLGLVAVMIASVSAAVGAAVGLTQLLG